MRTCKVIDCGGKHKGHGYCSKHYQRFKERGTVEGFAPREKINGLGNTPEYEAWIGMKKRCYNPKTHQYKDWGGRGIKVCDRWLHSFLNFLADMGNRPSPKHSIDRKNNNGNYTPRNCQWSTGSEQAVNRRKRGHYFKKAIRNSSGYRGVYWYAPGNYWVAKLMYKKRLLHFGCFKNAKDAAVAWDKAASKLYGNTTPRNFY